jgi:hypothetical protein
MKRDPSYQVSCEEEVAMNHELMEKPSINSCKYFQEYI